MTWHIKVDADTCIGSGMCAGLAPEHFELVGGYSRPVKDDVEPDDIVLDAADSCPVEAITVSEGKEVIGPRP